MKDMKALQNGSDIRGIALPVEGYEVNLTTDMVKKIGWGLANWIKKKKKSTNPNKKWTIGIGHDSRISGPALKEALIQSLKEQGIHVIDFELATTPAMFMSTQFEQFSCDAAVMLTASHLPYYYNGIKFFTSEGGAEKEDIAFILSQQQKIKSEQTGSVEKADLLTRYAQDLVTKIKKGMGTQDDKPLKGWKIIVDAGNGAGGFFAEKVLNSLCADSTGSQFLEPDGRFPNHIPNPDNKEAMESIKQAVLANEADLGIIFDTDVDRSAVVSASGTVINRNNLIAVLSTIVLKEHPGTRIVTNSPTSSHLQRFIEEKGGIQVRYISGYRNVINKALELNRLGKDTQLAIETSGHAAFKENYFLDDGAYVIAKILMLLPELKRKGITLDEQIKELKQPVEVQEIRLKLFSDEPREQGNKILEEMKRLLEEEKGMNFDPENEEGIRYDLEEPYGNGWFLIRLSLHEPLLVLQIENDEFGKNKLALVKLAKLFGHFSDLESLTAE
ncbi:TPA: phosphomannomutase/phosphoglucomutase [Enterococcus faecium]